MESRPLRLLEACGPILGHLAVAACPGRRPVRKLNEQIVAGADHFRETVQLSVSDAQEIKEALSIDIALANADSNIGLRHRDEAQEVMDALQSRRCGVPVVVLDAAHGVLSRTIARITLRATDDLRAQAAAERAIDRSVVEPAIETLATTIDLFDRLVQESAGDHEAADDDEPEPSRDKTVNSRLAAARRDCPSNALVDANVGQRESRTTPA